MSELVNKLSQGEHRAEVVLRPEKSVPALKDAITRGYVHIKFPDTRGGTELTVKLDPALSSMASADFDAGSGTVTLAGNLTLDYVPVQCIAEIQLPGLSGSGRLVRLEP